MDRAQTIRVGESVYRPVVDRTLTPDDLKKATEELNETPETRAECLETFKDMIEGVEDFTVRMDDEYLLKFLRPRKFNCEVALKLLKDYWKYREKHPQVFPAPVALKEVLEKGIINCFRHRDDEGRAVIIFKIGPWDTNKTTLSDLVAAGTLLCEWLLDNPVTQVNGISGIYDFQGATMKHFFSVCSPRQMWIPLRLMQGCLPARVKDGFLVNCLDIVDKGWRCCKPFLKEKLKNRVHICGSEISVLHQFLDPAILPQEYGGARPPSDSSTMLKIAENWEDQYQRSVNFGFRKPTKLA